MIGPTTYRLAWRRRMTQRYKALAIVAVLMVGALTVLPAGISTTSTAIVTGHSTFFNGDGYDPCLASIVGIMRMRVMWFNDMVLVERYNGDGAYIYVTEAAAPSPLADRNLVGSGVFYDFVDPNGVEWHVEEAYWDENVTFVPGGVGLNPNPGALAADPAGVLMKSVRYYTWIVAVGRVQRDAWKGSDNHDAYNFVTLVNTCKFNGGNATAELVNHDNPGPHNGHTSNDKGHTHESYAVNLWVGTAPKILPVGAETPNWVAARVGGAGAGAGNDPPAGTP